MINKRVGRRCQLDRIFCPSITTTSAGERSVQYPFFSLRFVQVRPSVHSSFLPVLVIYLNDHVLSHYLTVLIGRPVVPSSAENIFNVLPLSSIAPPQLKYGQSKQEEC